MYSEVKMSSKAQTPANIKWQSSKHYEAGDPEPKLQPNIVTIYSMRFCPFAQRTRLVLQHKQIPYQIVNCSLVKKPDWFLAKSPAGKTPTLLEVDGWVLEDSFICSDYLEDKHPSPPLYPKDPKQRARIRQAIAKMNEVFIPSFYKFYLGPPGEPQKAEWENLLKALSSLQDDLGTYAYFGGGTKVQMADYMIWPWIERLPALGQLLGYQLPKERFGRLLAWIDRMGSERAVAETRTVDSFHVEFLKTFKEKNPKYDGY